MSTSQYYAWISLLTASRVREWGFLLLTLVTKSEHSDLRLVLDQVQSLHQKARNSPKLSGIYDFRANFLLHLTEESFALICNMSDLLVKSKLATSHNDDQTVIGFHLYEGTLLANLLQEKLGYNFFLPKSNILGSSRKQLPLHLPVPFFPFNREDLCFPPDPLPFTSIPRRMEMISNYLYYGHPVIDM